MRFWRNFAVIGRNFAVIALCNSLSISVANYAEKGTKKELKITLVKAVGFLVFFLMFRGRFAPFFAQNLRKKQKGKNKRKETNQQPERSGKKKLFRGVLTYINIQESKPLYIK